MFTVQTDLSTVKYVIVLSMLLSFSQRSDLCKTQFLNLIHISSNTEALESWVGLGDTRRCQSLTFIQIGHLKQITISIYLTEYVC